jgi:hypothetical protein
MAQREHLRKCIVEFLQQSQDKTSSLKGITQSLGKDKKCINQVLYSLKRQNALIQVGTSPPVWKLRDRGMAMKAPLWPQNNKYKPHVSSPKKRIKNSKEVWYIFGDYKIYFWRLVGKSHYATFTFAKFKI